MRVQLFAPPKQLFANCLYCKFMVTWCIPLLMLVRISLNAHGRNVFRGLTDWTHGLAD